MRVVDWRPLAERWLSGRGQGSGGSAGAGIAGPLADALARARDARRPPPPAGVLVVSVGNLRLGGTGKTPVVLAVARALQARGRRGAVLLRGYGSATTRPLPVEATDRRAADEARFLAAQLRETAATDLAPWRVVQARRRADGLAMLLMETPPPEVVLLEDGFQTGGVGRHLDVLILDAWQTDADRLYPRGGRVIPFGPYRESDRGAARAQVWLLETAAPSDLAAKPALGRARILGFQRRHFLEPVGAPQAAADGGPQAADVAARRWGLLAGLARPRRFEAEAVALVPGRAVLAIRCRDHCDYQRGLLGRILAAGERAAVTDWATTAKDWIKLQALWPPALPVHIVRQEVIWTGTQTLPELIGERLDAMRGAAF